MKDEDLSESWSHRRFKVRFRTGDEENQHLRDVINEPIVSDSLIDEMIKPPSTPPPELYSNNSFYELFKKKFSEDDITTLLSFYKWERPLKNTEHIIQFPFMDLVDTSGWGIGKTTGVLLGGLALVAGNFSSYIFSLSYSGALGVTHQKKYNELGHYLTDGDERAVHFKRDMKELKKRIRKGKEPYSMLITHPQSFFGTLAHHSPFLENTRQAYLSPKSTRGKYRSPNPQWYETLLNPTMVFIDEIDAYPSYMIPVFAHMVRVLKWHNPLVQTILASATLGNPEVVAPRFFGAKKEYVTLNGAGRRGRLNIRVYEEEEKRLFSKIKSHLHAHVAWELHLYKQDRTYTPRKAIFYIDHKATINYKEMKGDFSKYFSTVHGGLPFPQVQAELREFENNKKKIVLVTTQLIHVGVDLSDVTWGILYGLPKGPKHVQKYMQLLARFVRDPADTGWVDIILRKKDDFERSLIENQEKRRAFILRDEPVSSVVPYYTLQSLRFWIVIGVLCGFYEILKDISKDLSDLDCPYNYQKHLSDTVPYLLSKNIIRYGANGKLLPTSWTQGWIYDFIKPSNAAIYEIILKDGKNDTETVIGRVNQLQLYLYSLEGQSLPWRGRNYCVIRIDDEVKKVFVRPASPELQLPRNFLSKPIYYRLHLQAYDQTQGIALIEVASERIVTENDSRTRSKRRLHSYQITHKYPAVFFQLPADLTEEEVETQISNLKDRLRLELLLDPDELAFDYFRDERFGSGVILIDTSEHDLAEFIYVFLVSTSGSLDLSSSDQCLSPVPYGSETYSFKRLPRFLNTYLTTVLVFTDLHLDGTPFVVYGKEVDFRSFWQQVIGAIREAMDNASGQILLVFLGDSYDKTQVVDRKEANKQLDILQEVLYENNLFNRSVFILGNHDYRSDIYAWKLPVKTQTELVLDISPTRRLFLLHGNNCGLEPWMGKKTLVEKDIQAIRSKINYHKQISDSGKKKEAEKKVLVRPQDLVGIGHLHTIGILNLNLKFIAVPPLRKILKDFPSGKFGCIGLFGYGTDWEPDEWDIKIDRLLIQKAILNY